MWLFCNAALKLGNFPFCSCQGWKVNTKGDLWIFPPLFVLALTQDDIYREAVTDGFLLDNPSGTSPTTESPKRNATVQASKQPSSVLEDNKMVYDSDLGDTNDYSATSDDFSSDQSSTQSPQSDFTSSSVPTKAKPSISPDHISSFQSTDPNLSIDDSSDFSESGSKMEVTDLPTAETVEPESNHLQPNTGKYTIPAPIVMPTITMILSLL